jgi:hypothetical protein
MTTTAELHEIAARTTWPAGAAAVVAVVDVTPGGRLATGVPSGLGVESRYGAAFFDGLRRSPAIAWFPAQRDAFRLIDILRTGTALRFAPHSVAARQADSGGGGPEVDEPSGTAERGAVQSAGQVARRRQPSRRPVAAAAAHRPDDALTPPAEASVVERVGAEPGGPSCKACGRDLSSLPRSRTGQRRQTCDDACRQAFARGERAPLPGVVADDELTRLSRLSRSPQTGSGSAPTSGPDAQLFDLTYGAPAEGST